MDINWNTIFLKYIYIYIYFIFLKYKGDNDYAKGAGSFFFDFLRVSERNDTYAVLI